MHNVLGIDSPVGYKLRVPLAANADCSITCAADVRGAEGGVGLGLSIAREIVRRMGGEVYVDSEAGRGSEFGFSLASGG